MGGLAALEEHCAVQGVAPHPIPGWRGRGSAPAAAVQADAHQGGVVAVQAGGSRGEHGSRQLGVAPAVLAQGLGSMSQQIAHLVAIRR